VFGKVFDGRWKRLGMLASVSACFCYLVAPPPEEPITSGISHNCAFENVVCRTAVPIDIHRQALRAASTTVSVIRKRAEPRHSRKPELSGTASKRLCQENTS
jgi:hypothetical protein